MNHKHKLRENALSFFESLVLGIAGSGPANAISLAMGALIAAAGLLSPLYVLVFAVPMLGIALAYKALNKRTTHAGAAYNWAGQAFGKINGFMAGWALITAQMIFIISGVVPLSTAVLDFINPALVNNVVVVTVLSALWFLFIVGIIMLGIKMTSYLQIAMLSFEMIVLLGVGIAALVKAHTIPFANAFSWHLYSPSYLIHNFSAASFSASALIVVFLYWGWDVTANLGEETKDGAHAAGNGGLSGVIVTIFLYSLYAGAALVLFTFAQTANFSSNLLYEISIAAGLGRTGGLVASIAVIFSSVATVQTGMLQVTRTLFAMGRDGALPHYLGSVHEKTQNPMPATYWLIGTGLLGIFLTGFMPSVGSILSDGVTASGLQVAYYFGMAGLVSAWVFRRSYRHSWLHWFAFSLFPGISAVFLIGLGLFAITTLQYHHHRGGCRHAAGRCRVLPSRPLPAGYGCTSLAGRSRQHLKIRKPACAMRAGRAALDRIGPPLMSTPSHHDWRKLAETITLPSQLFINGEFTQPLSGATFTKRNPATGAVLAQVARAEAADVDRAVRAARAAFADRRWSGKSLAQRRAVLLRLAELIEAHTDELALIESLDMGKPVAEAAAIDIPGAAAVWRYYAEALDKVPGEVAPVDTGNLAIVRRVPLGVVGAIIPWNFPFDIAAWKCAPALAAGNCVVLKPSERSPFSALRLAALASEAGLPDGVLNVVTGMGRGAGDALALHGDVDCLAFTGSTRVGSALMEYSGQSNLKQVWLELGGKSPNLVFADTKDLDAAARMAIFGIFFNAGQVCSANARLLVERRIQKEFVERLVALAQEMQPGDPLNPQSRMGAMVDKAHLAHVMGFVEAARPHARLAAGGAPALVHPGGAFMQPTIFDGVEPSSPLAREEVFGPVLSVIGFDNEEEAIRLANDTPFGLAASVWTADLDRALRVSDQLQAGTVSVNTVDALSPQTPFGGMGQSGFGRDLSLHALDKFTALKTVWIKYTA